MAWPKGVTQSPEHRARIAATRRAHTAAGAVSPRKGRHGTVTCPHPDRPYFAKGQCGSCYQLAWQKAHPQPQTWNQLHPDQSKAHVRRHFLRVRYGLTPEDVARMYHEQAGRCANQGCLAPMPVEALHVDHDHATGRVRALLCSACNRTLGAAQDDTGRLLGLIDYLRNGSPLS